LFLEKIQNDKREATRNVNFLTVGREPEKARVDDPTPSVKLCEPPNSLI
jgi:hypothetical protein